MFATNNKIFHLIAKNGNSSKECNALFIKEPKILKVTVKPLTTYKIYIAITLYERAINLSIHQVTNLSRHKIVNMIIKID